MFCHPGIFLERSEKKISGIQEQDSRNMDFPIKYTRLSYDIVLLLQYTIFIPSPPGFRIGLRLSE
jgi:hypothetical protein